MRRALALALLLLALAPAARAASMSPDGVMISGSAFHPGALTVDAGTRVSWHNDDFLQHTVTADDGSFGSDRLSDGDAYAHTFATPGRYLYHCSIHLFMRGEIDVVDPHAGHGGGGEPRPGGSGAGAGIAVRLSGGELRARTAPPRPHARAVVERWWRERFAWRVVARARLDARGRAVVRLPRRDQGRGRVQVVLPAAEGQPRAVARIRVR
jgi:plastocyanin